MDLSVLKHQFEEHFGTEGQPLHLYFSPGRVNLIGEHTDYNGGYVFPCALSFGTYLAIRKTESADIKLATTNFSYEALVPLTELQQKHENEWVNYPLGVIDQFSQKGLRIAGLEMLYSGDIPNGAGLSSSASIEIVTAFAINDLYQFGIDRIELVKMGQKAENEFVGMNCGIMDQFASCMGFKDCAIFLDCETLDYDLVPIVLKDYKIVISNTNKQRKLTDSKYNERRAECEKGLEYLNKKYTFKNLGKIKLDEYLEIQDLIPETIIRKRVHHVISEDQRVIDAVKNLKKGNLIAFGNLMNQSHDSLRDDYEVTGIELDTLVDEARKIPGVLGSRMTGAGFGGCTVSIVHKDKINEFIEKVGKNYNEKTNLTAAFYVAEIGDGAKRLEMKHACSGANSLA